MINSFSFLLVSNSRSNNNDDTQINDGNDEDGEVVTISLSILNVVLLTSSVFYIWCLVLATRKLKKLTINNNENENGNRSSTVVGFGLKKLLVLSIIFICIVRIMTFAGITAMDIANVRAHYSPNPKKKEGEGDGMMVEDSSMKDIASLSVLQLIYSLFFHLPLHPLSTIDESTYSHTSSDNQHFYDSSMTILFDLPNAIVVSTYVLLTLVWAECFLQSRFHTESMMQWKRKWLMGYTIFNSCLFFGQIVLYVLIFYPGTDRSVKIVKGVIYSGMIATNLGACLVALFSYIYLNLRFAVSNTSIMFVLV